MNKLAMIVLSTLVTTVWPGFAQTPEDVKNFSDKTFDGSSSASIVEYKCKGGVCVTSEDKIVNVYMRPAHVEPRDEHGPHYGSKSRYRGPVELVGPQRVEVHEVTKNFEIVDREKFVRTRGFWSTLGGFGAGALTGTALGLALGGGLVPILGALLAFGLAGAMIGNSLGVVAAEDKPREFTRTVRYHRETERIF